MKKVIFSVVALLFVVGCQVNTISIVNVEKTTETKLK